jgi:hypothetical protein
MVAMWLPEGEASLAIPIAVHDVHIRNSYYQKGNRISGTSKCARSAHEERGRYMTTPAAAAQIFR